MDTSDEEKLLHSVAMQNAHSIFLARQRAEQELIRTKEALELKTRELANALAIKEASLQERDRARAEMEEARAAAQAANEAKTRFVNMISHELRTPLGAIAGYAELLEVGIHGPLNEGQHEFIARIRHNQKYILRLVNQLLDLAKIESGRIDLNAAPVAVRAILHGVKPMIEPQIQERGLRLEIELTDPTIFFYADRDRIEQIVLNLLSNAAKFTAAGGTISIATTVTSERVSLRVQDTGVGISADKLETVFEPFVQANSPLSGSARGTGLGLAISRQLARTMGGNLWVESELGVGSTFTLELPRAHEPLSQVDSDDMLAAERASS